MSAATQESLLVSRDNDIAHLRLNMAASGNRIPQPVVVQLARELRALAADASIKLVVLSADGPHFCQGRDQAKVTASAKPTPIELRTRMMDPIIDVYAAFRAIQVPIVAIVQGEAHGFGAALAGSADITICASDALFSFPELKSDMPPTLAMATVMDRMSPKALAWMVYTNTVFTADEALRAGLASTVVPAAELDAVARQTVEQLSQRSRDALAGVKQFLARARLQEFEQAADLGRNLLAVILSSR